MRFRLRSAGAGATLAAVCGIAGLALVARPAALRAQTLTGTLLLPDSVTPAAQVLVEVSVGARAPLRLLTDGRGVFRTRLPAADSVRLRVLRPGFRPFAPPAVRVAAGETREVRVVLAEQPVTIATVNVRESRVCGERADASAWQLWEQARTVLQSIELTERDSSLTVWTVEYQGDATPGGATVVQDSTIMQVPVEPPFPPVYHDSLFRYGYIRRVRDTTTYYAPNASVLADRRFVETHCFRVAEADSAPRGLIGVRFEPQRPPRHTGIAGTFWLDEESYLLRQIEFRYVNAPVNHRIPGTGGYVLFTQLASGHWVMNEWAIRMPGLVASRGLRVRSRIVYRVQQDETTLLHDAAADSLARRRMPRTPPPPRRTGRPRIW
jgi:hypothetical protein